MKDFTNGTESKQLFGFAVPMLMGNILQLMYYTTNTWVVGVFLGREALSAIGSSGMLIWMLVAMQIGVGSGFSVLISQYFGAKQDENVRTSIDTLLVSIFFFGLLVSLIGIGFHKYILHLMNVPENVFPIASSYLTVLFSGIFFTFGTSGINAILRGLGDSRTSLYFLIISNITNLGLDILFVKYMGYGIESIAVATMISQALSMFAAIVYLNKYHPILNISIRKYDFSKSIFNASLKIGIPSGLRQMSVSLGMTILISMVNKFGSAASAAYTIVGRIDSYSSLPAINFSMALSSFVGQNIGAQKYDRVINGLKATLVMTCILSLTMSMLAYFFRQEIMQFFSTDIEVIQYGSLYLSIVSPFYGVLAAYFAIGSIFRGAGDTFIPLIFNLIELWGIRLCISFVGSLYFGIAGVWWGIPISWSAGLIFVMIYFFVGNWRRKNWVAKTVHKT